MNHYINIYIYNIGWYMTTYEFKRHLSKTKDSESRVCVM